MIHRLYESWQEYMYVCVVCSSGAVKQQLPSTQIN
jgi:hypothetical protein